MDACAVLDLAIRWQSSLSERLELHTVVKPGLLVSVIAHRPPATPGPWRS